MTNPTRQQIIDAHEALEGLGRTAQRGAFSQVGKEAITIRKN